MAAPGTRGGRRAIMAAVGEWALVGELVITMRKLRLAGDADRRGRPVMEGRRRDEGHAAAGRALRVQTTARPLPSGLSKSEPSHNWGTPS